MMQPEQQPGHCGHECVCYAVEDDSPCDEKKCPHDTRKNDATAKQMEQPNDRKILYNRDITPEALANIQIGDWVEGIGDITCHFEQDFIRRVSKWIATRDAKQLSDENYASKVHHAQYLEYAKSDATANPCEDQGCNDTENCDEICENRRIYSQAQLNEKIAAAIAEHDKRPRPPCEECIYQAQAAKARAEVLKEFETRLGSKTVVRDGEGERCSSYALIEDMLDECSDNPKYMKRRGKP